MRIMQDICYRNAPGSIVNIKEQLEFIKYPKCPMCGNNTRLGIDFGEIGSTIWVLCKKCDWKKNITDYDSW